MKKWKDKKWYKIYETITKTLGYTVLTVLLVIGFGLVAITISAKMAEKKGQMPPFSMYTIISPSMTPNINVYDVVFVQNVDVSTLEVGDIISFYSTNSFFGNTPITHRIVSVNKESNNYSFVTKGDANAKIDNDLALGNNVIGKVLFKIPALGRIQFFLVSKFGWIIGILIPAVLVIGYDMMKLFKLMKTKKKIEYIKNEDNIENNNEDE